MPHKKNPIISENLTGIARMLKSYYSISLENVVLWHERDISHSSTERMYIPDSLGLTLYSIRKSIELLNGLKFDTSKTIEKDSRIFSSWYLHRILKKKEDARENIYNYVQNLFSSNISGLLDMGDVSHIYLKHVETLFNRVKGI